MKKITKTICSLAITFIVIASCCKKNNTTPNLLKGKIKSIKETLIVPNKNYLYNLHFFYDSIDGNLQKVTLNNKLYIEISKKIENYIVLKYDVSLRDSTASPSIIRVKAKLDNNGFINKLEYVDSSFMPLQDLMNVYIQNGYPDSLREFVDESKHYNFQIQSGNIIQSTHFYNVFFSGDNTVNLKYFYSNKLNKNILPSQYNGVYFYAAALSTTASDPLYLLGLNGYFPFKSNVNLLDSIVNVDYNTVSKFEYITNVSNEITNMKRYSSITSSTYNIEYY